MKCPPSTISEADTRDFFALRAQVRAGAEIILGSDVNSIGVLYAAPTPRPSISESIALAEARSKELGWPLATDSALAADMEDILRAHKPCDTLA